MFTKNQYAASTIYRVGPLLLTGLLWINGLAAQEKRNPKAPPKPLVEEPSEPADTQAAQPESSAAAEEKTQAPPGASAGAVALPDIESAVQMYEQSNYADAAIALQQVTEAEGVPEAEAQKAQFFLGKALYHLQFYQSALAVFDEISQKGATHRYFGQTLQWLAQLALQLPEPAGIIEKVGRYGVGQLQEFDNAESSALYYQLLFLMGRYKYQQGEFVEAIDLFRLVNANSPWYVQAKFFEGISHVRLHKAQPAIAAFRAILTTVEEEQAVGVTDEQRMKDLAWLSLARVYYSASNRVDEATGDRAVDGRVLGNAIEAWNRIDRSSEYWLDALFEESWAFFLADEYSRSLGNIHTLLSPYFKEAYYPEALVLKSVVFFANCQMDNASATVSQFHDRYDPVKTELEQVLARYEDNTQFFEFLERVRQDKANLSPRIKGIVSSALSDRTLLRHLEYHRVLGEEEKRLEEAPGNFRDSSVGARVLQDITLAKSFAIDQAGDLARSRYNRLIEELQDLLNQIDTVDLEIATYQRGQLSQELQQQQLEAARVGRGRVEVDEEHQVWPFDGEYWRDELGFYRQQVTSQCGR